MVNRRRGVSQREIFRKRVFRIRLMELVLILFAGFILARSFQLQIWENEDLVKRAASQHQRVIKVWGKRGSIYDWKGRALAISLEEESLAVDPKKFRAPEQIRQLARILGWKERKIRDRVKNGNGFSWVLRGIDPNRANAISEVNLPGVMLIREWRRFYPQGELAGNLLGFVGVDGNGLEGMEYHADSHLQGQPRYYQMQRDGFGTRIESRLREISVGGRDSLTAGLDVYLTLDLSLQYLLERVLHRGLEEHRARSGMALAMGSKSGRIRALAVGNNPGFDRASRGESFGFNPNTFSRSSPERWRNRVVTDAYEPGSTFKVFLVASAMEEHLVRPDTKFDCEQGKYRIGPAVIHDPKKYQILTVGEIIKYSSNIGAAKIGEKLGRETFFRYLKEFGFGEPTGIDFPGEARGELRPPPQWRPIDLATASFGQGVAVTPIQLLAAFAAVVNGGDLYRPYLIEKVVSSRGKAVFRTIPKRVRSVVSRNTSNAVRKMLEEVVEDGTGQKARVPGIRIAGKTGTSQKYDPVLGKYSSERLISSFLGVIPETAMEGISESSGEDLVVLVLLDEPRGLSWGGDVAAPIFGELVRTAGAVLRLARRDSETE